MSLISASAGAQIENFDQGPAGAAPAGWKCAVTGRGNARWQVEADASAPSKPHVLKQSGRGDFPWCVREGTAIKYVDAPVPRNVWHTLRVNFAGTRIEVILDGKRYIQLDDSHIDGAGAVGVWTKADSVTAFDDFTYGEPAPKP